MLRNLFCAPSADDQPLANHQPVNSLATLLISWLPAWRLTCTGGALLLLLSFSGAVVVAQVPRNVESAEHSPDPPSIFPPAEDDFDDDVEIVEIQFDEYGNEFCVIGDVDNIPFPGHHQTKAFEGEGSISYEYRLARVELTVEQYHEFISVYWPYYDGEPSFYQFTGLFMRGKQVGDEWVFSIDAGFEDAATNIALRQAARYCNWLHNGKVIEEWAFETGCYDASTFTRNPDGTYNDDYTVLPGARYWVPDVGEWLKGTFYDPGRYGKGEPGWWKYPNRSSEPLRVGIPSYGGPIQPHLRGTSQRLRHDGQTNAAAWDLILPQWAWEVGRYEREQSAWGLLDTSGGMCDIGLPASMGTSYLTPANAIVRDDAAGMWQGRVQSYPTWPAGGLRLASWPD